MGESPGRGRRRPRPPRSSRAIARVVERERFVGKSQIDGSEAAAAVRSGARRRASATKAGRASARTNSGISHTPVRACGGGTARPGTSRGRRALEAVRSSEPSGEAEALCAGRQSPRPSVRADTAVSLGRERPSLCRVRRRQPLLRGARCLHPVRRPEDAAALRPVVRGQRAQVPRRRRDRQSRGRQPHVRPGRQGRRDARLLPRQPEQAAAVRVPARTRADPGRVPRPRCTPRQARRVRPRGRVAVPHARNPLRGADQARHRSCDAHCSLRSTGGSTTTGASTTRAASSRRRTSRSPISTGRSASSNGRSTTAPVTS